MAAPPAPARLPLFTVKALFPHPALPRPFPLFSRSQPTAQAKELHPLPQHQQPRQANQQPRRKLPGEEPAQKAPTIDGIPSHITTPQSMRPSVTCR